MVTFDIACLRIVVSLNFLWIIEYLEILYLTTWSQKFLKKKKQEAHSAWTPSRCLHKGTFVDTHWNGIMLLKNSLDFCKLS